MLKSQNEVACKQEAERDVIVSQSDHASSTGPLHLISLGG